MADFNLGEINYLAVLVATVAHMAVGFLWYGPLFGETWMRAIGKTRDEVAEVAGSLPYAVSTLSALVIAFTLALFLTLPAQVDVVTGVVFGVIAALGFIAPAVATGAVFEGRPWTVTLLTIGYELISLVIMGAILGAWR